MEYAQNCHGSYGTLSQLQVGLFCNSVKSVPCVNPKNFLSLIFMKIAVIMHYGMGINLCFHNLFVFLDLLFLKNKKHEKFGTGTSNIVKKSPLEQRYRFIITDKR